MRLKQLLLGIATALFMLAGCNPATPTTSNPKGKLNIVVAFYPLAYVAQSIAGNTATITDLTTPGTEPHDLELKPHQINNLTKADLVIYSKGFQAQVDTAISQTKPKHVIDVSTIVKLRKFSENQNEVDHDQSSNHDHEGLDPHFWLDPNNMKLVANAITKELTALSPTHADTFTVNDHQLIAQLDKLNDAYKSGLASCKRKQIIVSHEAFGYLTSRYHLQQIGISGLSPDTDPSPARIAQIQKLAKKYGITTIFFETLASPVVAKSIASDLGLKTDVLDPLEGITPQSRGKNYLEVMESNLNSLKKANDCT